MATEALKSTVITNRDAVPKVLTNAEISGSFLLEAKGSVTTTSGVTTGSSYIMVTVPSNAIVSAVILSCGAMGGASAGNVGVYQNTVNGGAVVSASFFASAQTLVSALAATDITNSSGTYTYAKQEQPLWQALGVAADPITTYDIAVVSSATITTGAAMQLKVLYKI